MSRQCRRSHGVHPADYLSGDPRARGSSHGTVNRFTRPAGPDAAWLAAGRYTLAAIHSGPLRMDASLKQRLVGAAVLVALAVIFLPMLIGGPDSDTSTVGVSTDVPDRGDRQLETRELALVPPAPAASQDAIVDEDSSRVATVDMTGVPARVDALTGTPAASVTPAAVPAPASKPPVTPAPVAPAATGAPAPAASHPATTTAGRWAVNLGSYANAANATALVAQLRQQQLAAYTETVSLDGKSVQRVRLGPFAQRSEAESARLSVLKIRTDLPTGVISLEGENAPPAAKPAVAEGFAVQIGALRVRADAEDLRDRARAAGFSSYVERTDTAAGVLWRVRLGPELQRANAERLQGEAKAKLGVEANVVPHP